MGTAASDPVSGHGHSLASGLVTAPPPPHAWHPRYHRCLRGQYSKKSSASPWAKTSTLQDLCRRTSREAHKANRRHSSKGQAALFSRAPVKTQSRQQTQLAALKSGCNLFSRLYVSCQTRGADPEQFFTHENPGSTTTFVTRRQDATRQRKPYTAHAVVLTNYCLSGAVAIRPRRSECTKTPTLHRVCGDQLTSCLCGRC